MKVKPVPRSHHEGNTDLLPKLCCGAYALSPTQLEQQYCQFAYITTCLDHFQIWNCAMEGIMISV